MYARSRRPAPFKEGQTFREVTVFQGQEKQSTGEVVSVHENSTLIVRVVAVHSGPRLLPTRSYIVRPIDGGTELVWRSEVRVAGMMRLFVPLLPGLFRRKKAGYLLTLKELLEAQNVPASTGNLGTAVATRACIVGFPTMHARIRRSLTTCGAHRTVTLKAQPGRPPLAPDIQHSSKLLAWHIDDLAGAGVQRTAEVAARAERLRFHVRDRQVVEEQLRAAGCQHCQAVRAVPGDIAQRLRQRRCAKGQRAVV